MVWCAAKRDLAGPDEKLSQISTVQVLQQPFYRGVRQGVQDVCGPLCLLSQMSSRPRAGNLLPGVLEKVIPASPDHIP